MCRNIRILFNFDPPATDDEIRAAAIQIESGQLESGQLESGDSIERVELKRVA